MKNTITKLTCFAFVAAALLAVPAISRADDSTNAAAATPAPKKHSVPLHGKVATIDAQAMTFTVGDSTIYVTSTTKIFKNGQPGVFADITVGENVNVSYKKDDAGKMNANSVRIGGGKKAASTATNAPPAQ